MRPTTTAAVRPPYQIETEWEETLAIHRQLGGPGPIGSPWASLLSSGEPETESAPPCAEAPKVLEFGPREEMVLRALAETGESNPGLAKMANCSIPTIEGTLKRLRDKLHVENRTQIALWGVRNGYGSIK